MSEHLHDQANRAAILIANGLPKTKPDGKLARHHVRHERPTSTSG